MADEERAPKMRLALGMLEFRSVAKGIEATDSMLKAASVELLFARPICPGKWLVVVAGEVAAVESAVAAGKEVSPEQLVDELVLAQVHESVLPSLAAATPVSSLGSLGVIEAFSAATCLEAADAAAKAAEIQLVELRLPAGLGGKAFVTLTGSVAAVEAAVRAGAGLAERKGMLVESVVIPAPAFELTPTLL